MLQVTITDKDELGWDEIYTVFYLCPECGNRSITYKDNYCSGCGNSIKWKLNNVSKTNNNDKEN